MSGAKSNGVGKDTEQRLARWLRGNGWPSAERTVRTGYRVTNRTLADAGDIDGTPGICWQAKSLRPADRAEREVAGWLLEVEQQRVQSDADLGILVVRRWGTTDVGRWWAFLDTVDLVQAADGLIAAFPADVVMPVRMELRHMTVLLHAWGYGSPAAVAEGAA